MDTDPSRWFALQLQTSADAFAWAVGQLTPERRSVPPPLHPDEWPALRHVFHMAAYERYVALPSMRQWQGGPPVSLEGLDEDVMWNGGQGQDLADLLASFHQVRSEQIALLPQFDASAWEEPRATVWGAVTLRWVVTKTFQHTCEHTHDVLRMALWWGGRPSDLSR